MVARASIDPGLSPRTRIPSSPGRMVRAGILVALWVFPCGRPGAGADVAADVAADADGQARAGADARGLAGAGADVAAEPYSYAGYAVYAAGVVPEDLVVADLDGDGLLDLAIANSNATGAPGIERDTVSVYINAGSGTAGAGTPSAAALAPPVEYPVGDRPEGIAAGDFDRDGVLDLATANFEGDTVSLLLGEGGASEDESPGHIGGNGTFTPVAPLRVPGGPRSVVARDLDGDGTVDLATANYRSSTISILEGAGDGSFELVGSLATGRGPEVIASGHFDDDGIVDLATADALGSVVSVFVGEGSGSLGGSAGFRRMQTLRVGEGPRHVRAADLDQDGTDEIVVACYRSHEVRVLENVSGRSFEEVASIATPAMEGPVYSSVADLDRDGRLDLLVTFAFSRSLVAYPGGPGLTFGTGQVIPTGENPVGVAVGDLDRNDHPDLIVTNALEDTVLVFWGSARPGIVTIDDGASGTSSTGEWTPSSATVPFGGGSHHSSQAGGATYRWSAALDPGTYGVHAWWSSEGGRNPRAPYTVEHVGAPEAVTSSATTVTVDQNRGAGRWNLLGVFPFDREGVVEVESTSGVFSTCADAVAFIPLLGGGSFPWQLPSDCNQDGGLDVSDVICLLRGLFLGAREAFPCGPAPAGGGDAGGPTRGGNLALLDANGDASLDVSDPIYLLNHLFAGGSPPVLGRRCVALPAFAGCLSVCVEGESRASRRRGLALEILGAQPSPPSGAQGATPSPGEPETRTSGLASDPGRAHGLPQGAVEIEIQGAVLHEIPRDTGKRPRHLPSPALEEPAFLAARGRPDHACATPKLLEAARQPSLAHADGVHLDVADRGRQQVRPSFLEEFQIALGIVPLVRGRKDLEHAYHPAAPQVVDDQVVTRLGGHLLDALGVGHGAARRSRVLRLLSSRSRGLAEIEVGTPPVRWALDLHERHFLVDREGQPSGDLRLEAVVDLADPQVVDLAPRASVDPGGFETPHVLNVPGRNAARNRERRHPARGGRRGGARGRSRTPALPGKGPRAHHVAPPPPAEAGGWALHGRRLSAKPERRRRFETNALPERGLRQVEADRKIDGPTTAGVLAIEAR